MVGTSLSATHTSSLSTEDGRGFAPLPRRGPTDFPLACSLGRTPWERRWEWPLTVLAAAFLAAYAWPILPPDLSAPAKRLLLGFTWLTWTFCILDDLVRWPLSAIACGS